MTGYIEYLNIPVGIALALVFVFFVMQTIGEILEFKGKVVPEFLKVRKFFSRRKQEKKERAETLHEVKNLLADVNSHYSADNIAMRNEWMKWVGDRAEVYDKSIVDITEKLVDVTSALKDNTKMTEELFVQNSRDRIIDFSHRAADDNMPISREEFHRAFKVYTKYEQFLEDHGMTNGEIDLVFQIIKESYGTRMRNHSFIEDTRTNLSPGDV